MVLACASLPSVALSSCACLSLLCVMLTRKPHRRQQFRAHFWVPRAQQSWKILQFWVQMGQKSWKMQHSWVQRAQISWKAANLCAESTQILESAAFQSAPSRVSGGFALPTGKDLRSHEMSLEIYRIIWTARVHIQNPWTADLDITNFSGNKNM